MTAPHQAILLAAGLGSRLRPVTEVTPKALVPFYGAPLLDHAVSHMVEAGVRRIAVNAYHLADTLARYVETVMVGRYPDVSFWVSHEPQLLGTGGAIMHLSHWLEDGPFWVMNTDAVTLADLGAMARVHDQSRADATWLLWSGEAPVTLKRVRVDGEGRVLGVHKEGATDGYVFGGVHIASAALLGRLQSGISCVMWEGYVPWLDAGARLVGYRSAAPWADTGTPERYLDAHRLFWPHIDTLRARLGAP